MGLDRKVILDSNRVPTWQAWTGLLAERQLSVQIRMIDGELAFPDEVPSPDWKELRVGLPGGMITLRREADGIRVVTWGNATAEALKEWKLTMWALAKAGQGRIEADSGTQTADEFERTEGI